MKLPAAILVTLTLIANPALPADQEGSGENRVRLNVVVLDKHGDPVSGLTAADFQITDRGKPQKIALFRSNETQLDKKTALSTGEYSNRAGAPPQATLVLFDLLNADLNDRGYAEAQIIKAMEPLESTRNVYLYLLTAEARIFAVHGLDSPPPASGEWTAQIHPLLDRALHDVFQMKPIEMQYVDYRVRTTLMAFDSLAAQLAAVPGRKTIVWVTHGIPIEIGPRRSLTGDFIDYTPLIRTMSEMLQRANIAVYPVQMSPPGMESTSVGAESASSPGGGRRSSPESGASAVAPGVNSADTLQQFADLTGGHEFGNQDVRGALNQAIRDSRQTYLLGYDPPEDSWDGKLHKIKVTCNRKGLKVQAMQEYFADPARMMNDDQLRAALQLATWSPFDAAEIGVRAILEPAKQPSTLHFQIHINGNDLMLEHVDGGYKGRILVGFVDLDGSQGHATDPEMFDLKLTDAQYADAMKEGLNLPRDHAVPAGTQRVRVVVLDVESHETGSLTVPANPPAAKP